jgi:hypothetical protein
MRRATSKILGKVPKRSSPTSAPAERPKSDCINKQTDKYGTSMAAIGRVRREYHDAFDENANRTFNN